jgi:phenylpropionate dioxygenase-like ring-hydroxylating dioxygenase large terminal subunit
MSALPRPIARHVASLVEDDRVHRDLYTSPEVFAYEQRTVFANAWVFAGHDSQIPAAGDYLTVDVGGHPLVVVRQADGGVRALVNRCAHKGAKVVNDAAGHAGRALRCPYHAWAYRLDGSLLALPLPQAYEGTAMRAGPAGQGLTPVATAVYRGFVFVRLAPEGPDFETYCGPVLAAIDAMADRSPAGVLEAVGPPIRSIIRCNWKIYLENINDSLHVVSTHGASADAAVDVWSRVPGDTPKPMAMEQLLPFSAGYDFAEKMGSQVFANGHSILGTRTSLHVSYAGLPEYEAAMVQAYGAERAQRILSWTPQNAVVYPSIAIKGSPQTMRVLRPLAVDRTLIEVWALRPKGAPEFLVERTELYNRLVFSPMSLVAADDIQVFEGAQAALASDPNPWVSLHRGYAPDERGVDGHESDGLDEVLMRNQYRAWAKLAAAGGDAR